MTEFTNDKFYDVVILSVILEHLESPDELMTMAAGFRQQNGLILISIPNGLGPSELERKFLEVFKIDILLICLKSVIGAVVGSKSDAYNADSVHLQLSRSKEIVGFIEGADLSLNKKGKGSLFGGGVTYPIGILCPWIVEPSLRLAHKVTVQYRLNLVL